MCALRMICIIVVLCHQLTFSISKHHSRLIQPYQHYSDSTTSTIQRFNHINTTASQPHQHYSDSTTSTLQRLRLPKHRRHRRGFGISILNHESLCSFSDMYTESRAMNFYRYISSVCCNGCNFLICFLYSNTQL